MKFSVKKRMGLLGLGSAVMIAAAALGMHGFQVLGTEENVIGDVYPEEEFFETETDMTEFEGKLEDITA